jgi:hypothetical protein
MIYRLAILMVTISLFACNEKPIRKHTQPFSFIDSVFSKRSYNVEVVDVEFSEEIQSIVLRFQKAMAEQKEWTEEFFSKNYKEGEGLPYHPNMRVTEEEYQKVKDLDSSSMKQVIKPAGFIKIKRGTDFLSFSATNPGLGFMDSLKIDFGTESVIFLNDTIPFQKEINTSSSALTSQWQGYLWKKELSNFREDDILKIDSAVIAIAEVNIGKLVSNNKILLRLKHKKVDKGELLDNLDVLLYLY